MSSSALPDISSDDDSIGNARGRFGRGANVYEQTGKHSNALHDASLQGNLDTVRYLLDNSVDVNAQGGRYGTALQAASYHQANMLILQHLLDHGANVNAQGGKYGTALQAASRIGNIHNVLFLLGKGAEVNAQGGEYGTALQAASRHGHLDIVECLLAFHAKVYTHGGRYGNALQAASRGGHHEIFELLLKHLNINQVISTAIDDLKVFHSDEDIMTIVCHMDWEVLACRKMEAEDLDDISQLVTFTGTSEQAQAATCVDYMRQTWPKTGNIMMHALQQAIVNRTHDVTIAPQHHVKLLLKDAVDEIGQTESARVEITGSRTDVIETLEQLSWFAATFREHHGDTIMCSFANLVPAPEYRMSTTSPPHLKLSILSSDLAATNTRTPSNCWMSMLRNSILACGFPSAPRTEGLGLEVPPAIMMYLAGVTYPTQWTTSSQGLIFRSCSRPDEEDISILVPVQQLKNGIQWHLIRTKSPLGTLIDKEDSRFINGMMDGTTEWYKTDDVDLLMRSRGFLGCWSQAEVLIGTSYFSTKVFGFSDLDDAGRSIWVSTQSSLTVGGNLSAGVSSLLRLGAMFSVPIGFRVRGPQRRVIDASQLGQQVMFRNASEQPLLL